MNKKLLATSVLIIATISVISIAALMTPSEYVYVQSDITKANPNLKVLPTEVSMRTHNISETKDTVVLTLSGTVMSVGDPIVWKYKSVTQGSVPVTIDVSKKTKDKDTELVHNGDSFTFYLTGTYEHEEHFIFGFEPQFELGENVIVHIGKSVHGPNGENGNNYFVELGKYGKYKIVGDKAYNEKDSVNLAGGGFIINTLQMFHIAHKKHIKCITIAATK